MSRIRNRSNSQNTKNEQIWTKFIYMDILTYWTQLTKSGRLVFKTQPTYTSFFSSFINY